MRKWEGADGAGRRGRAREREGQRQGRRAAGSMKNCEELQHQSDGMWSEEQGRDVERRTKITPRLRAVLDFHFHAAGTSECLSTNKDRTHP